MSSRFLICFLFLLLKQAFAAFENAALRRPAYQSSENKGYEGSAYKAVDGITNGTWKQIMHTSVLKNSTWWEVDLQKLYFIHDVRIYFRISFKWRRNGVQVYTNTKERQANRGHLCGTVTGKPDGSDIDDITSITCDVTARYVTIYQGTDNGMSTALDFYETEVYACEVNTKYGSNCDKWCTDRHCSVTSSSCDVRTGHCDTGSCQPGWMGSDCSTACIQNHTYGPNCNKLCISRHCLSSNAVCNVQTGDCGTDGCKAGWKGTDCTQDSSKKSTDPTVTILLVFTGLLCLYAVISVIIIIRLVLLLRKRPHQTEPPVSFAKQHDDKQSTTAGTVSAAYEISDDDEHHHDPVSSTENTSSETPVYEQLKVKDTKHK